MAGLAKKMTQAGYSLTEWSIPQAAKDILDPPDEAKDKKKDSDEAPAQASPADDDPTPIEVQRRKDTLDRGSIDRALDD